MTVLPLAGCGGGGPDYPAVSSNANPLASAGTAQFQALPRQHALLVTDGKGRKVVQGGVGRAPGRMNAPAGVAVLDNRAYVVETGNHRVQVFDDSGASLGTIGEGELLYPGGIDAGRDEIFVADSRHARIVAFTPDGRLTRVLGLGALSAPRGLQVLERGVLVADPGLRKVVQLGFDGRIEREFGADWVLPWDVATDGEFFYVADVSANQLAVVDAAGLRVDAIPLDFAPANVWYEDKTLQVVPHA